MFLQGIDFYNLNIQNTQKSKNFVFFKCQFFEKIKLLKLSEIAETLTKTSETFQKSMRICQNS